MDIIQVEKRRSELLQLVVFMIMLFLGLVTYQSVQNDEGYLTPALGLLSLLACLYVIGQERTLKHLQQQLVEELVMKDRQVVQLGREYSDARHKLKDEESQKIQVEGRLHEVSMLYKAISVVNAVQDPQRTSESVLRSALDLVEGDCGSVMLLEGDGATLVIVAAQGLSETVKLKTRQPISDGIAGWVVRHKEPLLVTEELKDDPELRPLMQHSRNDQAAMSVPLQVRGQVIGVINVSVSEQAAKRRFDDRDLRLVALFAQHASVAIDNGRLLASLRQTRAAVQSAAGGNGGPRTDLQVN
ncbi:MAG: GAF domain-containing protein [Nitrospirae bacterium]|nr:GAF domain-containing protein [Nitrospirota bacterium]